MVVPQLPPEMIGRIQTVAEWGEDSGERKKLRAKFELVNSEWKGLVDHSTDILILSYADLARLTGSLAEDESRTAVEVKARAIEINMQPLGKEKRVPELIEAVKHLVLCEKVVIYGEWGWATFGGLWSSEPDQVGLDLLDALLGLAHTRHFDYSGCTSCDGSTASITQAQISRMGREWPKLETLRLTQCAIEDVDESDDKDEDQDQEGILSHFNRLKALSIQHEVQQDAFVRLMNDLPDSITSFSVGVIGLYDDEFALAVEMLLAPSAPNFTHFTLLDPIEEGTLNDRGLYDDLILSLVNVQKLTISPHAVSNLAAVLGALPRLAHVVLALREYDDYAVETTEAPIEEGQPEFPAKEVLTLVNSVPQLRRVEILSNTRAGWPAKERKAIGRAASRHGVKLDWVTWEEADEWPFIYPTI